MRNSDMPELRLSALQLKVFDDWKRPAEALPPPAWYTAQERVSEPTMSSSRTIDLVQDAATDCSVVASLCALVARGERGHAKVSIPNALISVTFLTIPRFWDPSCIPTMPKKAVPKCRPAESTH
jgi:hypothetical protein